MTLVTNIAGWKRYVCWRRSRVAAYVTLLPNPDRAASWGIDLGVQQLADLPERACGTSLHRLQPAEIPSAQDQAGRPIVGYFWPGRESVHLERPKMGMLRGGIRRVRQRHQGWQRPEHPVPEKSAGRFVRDELSDT